MSDRERLLPGSAVAALADTDAEHALKAPFDALQGDAVDRMLYADSKMRLPDHPVMITDRMTHGARTGNAQSRSWITSWRNSPPVCPGR